MLPRQFRVSTSVNTRHETGRLLFWTKILANLETGFSVSPHIERFVGPGGHRPGSAQPEEQMGILQKLFTRKALPTQRVRICVECGMPVAEHKDWCSIFRTQQEMAQKAAVASPSS